MKLKDISYTDIKHLKWIFSTVTVEDAENGAVVLGVELYNLFVYKKHYTDFFEIKLFFDNLKGILPRSINSEEACVYISKVLNYFFDYDGELLYTNSNRSLVKILEKYYDEKYSKNLGKLLNDNIDYFIVLFNKSNNGLIENVLMQSNIILDNKIYIDKCANLKKDISEVYVSTDEKMNQNVEDIKRIRDLEDLKNLLPSYYLFFEEEYESLFDYLLSKNELLSFNYSGQLEVNKKINIRFYFNYVNNKISEINEKKYILTSFLKEIFLYVFYALFREFVLNKFLQKNDFEFFLNSQRIYFDDNLLSFSEDIAENFELFKSFILETNPDFFVLYHFQDNNYHNYRKSKHINEININIFFEDDFAILKNKYFFNNYSNYSILVKFIDELKSMKGAESLQIFESKIFELHYTTYRERVNIYELIKNIVLFVVSNIIEDRW